MTSLLISSLSDRLKVFGTLHTNFTARALGRAFLLACLLSVTVSPVFPQGAASSGARAQPKRPLPKGMTPPKVDFRT